MRLSDARWFVVDCETDSKDAATALPVEIAALELAYQDGHFWRRPLSTTLVNPGRPIDVRATAIHGITDEMVRYAPSVKYALEWLADLIPSDVIVVAHHAEYDRTVLDSIGSRRWLCTERLAHHLYPDAPSFKNDVLRHHLRVRPDTAGLPSHRAAADSIVTGAILAKEISDYVPTHGDDVDELLAFAETLYLWKRMPFGKHFDAPLADVPASYMRWALDGGMSDLSPDMQHTFETEFTRRRQEAA